VDRTQQTAQFLGEKLSLLPSTRPELSEIDYGAWSGKGLDELRPLDEWRQFNSFRSGSRIPGGELMLQTQLRVVDFMLRLREVHPEGVVALVSHGDVIKAAVAYFLGVPLDLFLRIEISPASVSVVAIADYGPWVLGVNHVGELPLLP
jgi:broad specificity phosphatase PhoE